MIRWIILAVLVVAVSAAIPFVVTSLPADSTGATVLAPVKPKHQGPQGKLFVEGEPVHRFPVMSTRTEGKKTWAVKNVGEGNLKIEIGSYTCMCTVAELAPDPKTLQKRDALVLKPGETTELTVTWNTKDKVGPFEQSTSIVTSDPDQQDFWFRIVGEVQPPILTDPPMLDYAFGRVPSTEPATAPLWMASPDRPEFQVTKLEFSNPDSVTASVRPMTEEEQKKMPSAQGKGGYLATIEVKPSSVLGDFREEVVLKTDHPAQPELRITVSGRRTGPIDVIPPRIEIRDANAARGGSQTLLINVLDGRETAFTVEESSLPEGLQVRVEPADNQGRETKVRPYRLTATVPPGTPAGEIEGDVVLTTDHPGIERLKVPVDAVILSGGN
jgi:hypothetical protein